MAKFEISVVPDTEEMIFSGSVHPHDLQRLRLSSEDVALIDHPGVMAEDILDMLAMAFRRMREQGGRIEE